MNFRLMLIARWVTDLIHFAPTDEIKQALTVIHDAAKTVSTDAKKIIAAFAAVAGDPFAEGVATTAVKELFPDGIPDAHKNAPPVKPLPVLPMPVLNATPAEAPV